MLATNISNIRNQFKEFCDKVSDDNEIVIITRKENKNVVLMSLDRYNEMEKNMKNYLFLSKIDRGFRQIESGRGISHELIED